jgi:hypothetical protein
MFLARQPTLGSSIGVNLWVSPDHLKMGFLATTRSGTLGHSRFGSESLDAATKALASMVRGLASTAFAEGLVLEPDPWALAMTTAK